MNESIDFMVISAHPDDAELGMGGTIAKMCSEKKAGVLVDLIWPTEASRGTPEIRNEEAKKSAKILGISKRLNLKMKDTALKINEDSENAVIQVLRKYRPKVVFTHAMQDYHPDHNVTAELVLRAIYLSGLKTRLPELLVWRPFRVFHFGGIRWQDPDFCVDISKHFDVRKKALQCFESQFYTENSEQFKGNSSISTPEFQKKVETRLHYLGTRIKTNYAEGFCCEEIPEVQNPCSLSGKSFI